MPKEITSQERQDIISEARAVLTDIWGLGVTRVNVEVKRGGYTAVAWPSHMKIVVRADCWKKMDLCSRRLVMVHESLHLIDWKHGSNSLYGNGVPDIASLELYKNIWGEDEVYRETLERVRTASDAALLEIRKAF